jgi:hypothetical protein
MPLPTMACTVRDLFWGCCRHHCGTGPILVSANIRASTLLRFLQALNEALLRECKWVIKGV